MKKMLRKEILERIHKVEEKIHVLASVFATSTVVTIVLEAWRRAGPEERKSLTGQILEQCSLCTDIAIAIIFLVVIAFKKFGLDKPNRVWWRVAKEKKLQTRLALWLTTAEGEEIPGKVRHCTESDLELLIHLNYEAFKNSKFAIEEETLEFRNREWHWRNPRIFMFILDPKDESVCIGYSAMVPLTADGMHAYLDGALLDAEIPADSIAKQRKSAAGVLLFAINFRKNVLQKPSDLEYKIYFLTCVRYHLKTLFNKTGKSKFPYPPIYVQTEYPGLARRLTDYGFEKTGRSSADGCEIFVLKRPFRFQEPNVIRILEEA